MIYFFVGNDSKNKKDKLKILAKNREVIFLSSKDLSEESLLEQANNKSLFDIKYLIVLENLITLGELILSKEVWLSLKDSETIFVLLEDKILASDVKKYEKYGNIEKFEKKEILAKEKFNSFSIADSFSSKDKIKTWVNYNEAIEKGATPEAISGMLFWKIKMMMLNGSNTFNKNELKKQSSTLVSLYHKSHNGELDMVIGLEQFILSVLSK